MGAPQSGATYSKGNESGPACKAGTHREDMGARQQRATYSEGKGIGMRTLRYQSGTAYTMDGKGNGMYGPPLPRRDILDKEFGRRIRAETYSEWKGIGMESGCLERRNAADTMVVDTIRFMPAREK